MSLFKVALLFVVCPVCGSPLVKFRDAGSTQMLDTDVSDFDDVLKDDIDPDSLMGHLFLTSHLHSIPVVYPSHYYTAVKSMHRTYHCFCSGNYCTCLSAESDDAQ